MKKLMLLLVCAAVAAASRGALPLYEPFQYTVLTPLVGQTHPMGYTWLGAGAPGPQQPSIQDGDLSYPGLALPIEERVIIRAGNGLSAVLPFATTAIGAPGGDNQDYPVTTGPVVYSLLLRVTDLTGLGGTGNAFAALSSYVSPGAVLAAPPSGYARVLLRADAVGGGYNIGLEKSTGAAVVWHPGVFTTAETVLIVGVYEFYAGANNDMAKLWINPSHTIYCVGPSAPDLTSIGGMDAADLGSFTYYQRPIPNAPARLLTDELRLGTTWQSVLPRGIDFGDADAAYRVTESENGARHILIPGVWLGAMVDGECDGVESAAADGDDNTGDADEDGVTWSGVFWPGFSKDIDVTASIDGKLDVWFDWDQDGVWEASEQVFDDEPIKEGTTTLSVPVPLGTPSGKTFARFRFSLLGVAGPVSLAPNGEVEDYVIQVYPLIDLIAGVSHPLPSEGIHINDDEPYLLSLNVTNPGLDTATDIRVDVNLPQYLEGVGVTSAQGYCEPSAGGVTCRLASLEPGQVASVVISLTAQADSLPGEDSYDLGDVTVRVSSAESDVHPENNQLAFPIAVFFGRDWGDAPEGYPVMGIENGARHRLTFFNSIRLGTAWDRETDGTHSPAADYDDTHGKVPDDEDGVSFIATTGTITVEVSVKGDGYLNAWMDFYRNQDWIDVDEQILTDIHLTTGTYTYNLTVPAGVSAGQLVSRWRYSENPGLPCDGPGGRGEVEDYVIDWEPEEADVLDFGDAPETLIIGGGGIAVLTGFPVTKARDGARHEYTGLMLGGVWDAEPDGQPSVDALLDDITGVPDDEDGVTLPVGGFIYGTTVDITVVVSAPGGGLDAWIDWNGNYNWEEPDERIATGLVLPAGTHKIAVTVPTKIPTRDRYARFRLSSASTPLTPLAQDGLATDGEVEDYLVFVQGDVEDNNDDGPNPVYFDGLEHVAQGDAALRASATGLEVSNMSSTGQDGLRINLGRSQGWRGNVVHGPEPIANGPIVYSVNIVGFKDSQGEQTLATMRVERQGQGLSLAADFSALGAGEYTAQFYDTNGDQIGTTTSFSNMQGFSVVPNCLTGGEFPDDKWIFFTDNTGMLHMVMFINGGCLSLPDGTEVPRGPILCLLSPRAETSAVASISAVDIRRVAGANGGSLLLENESVLQFGLWHQLLDGAILRVQDMAAAEEGPVLPVGQLGSSGQAGIETIVGGTEYIGLVPEINPLSPRVTMEFASGPAESFTLPGLGKFIATGRIEGSSNPTEPISTLSILRQEDGNIELSATFVPLGVTQVQVEVFNGDEYAGAVTLPAGMLGLLSESRLANVSFVDSADYAVWLVRFAAPANFSFFGGAMAGDRLLITALDAHARIEGLRSLIMRETGQESFMLGAGLTPKPRRPVLAIPHPRADGRLELEFSSEPGVVYTLERSHAMAPIRWKTVGARIGAAEDAHSRFVVFPEGPVCFYRLRAW